MRRTYITSEIKITDENDNEVGHFIKKYVTEDVECFEDLAELLLQEAQWNRANPIENRKKEIDKAYQE